MSRPFLSTIARQSTAALLIPALNEEAVIRATLESVPAGMFHTVMVADNGSTDRTAAISRECGATVVYEPERGYGAACLRAIAAMPDEIEVIVFMQADGSEESAEAENLLSPIYDGRADLVIGSRTLGTVYEGALLPHQRFGNWLATTLVKLIYGHTFTDLGPFRAIRRSALLDLGMADRNYGWTVEMQVRAIRKKLRVIEVPVSYRRRSAGINKVSGNLKASLAAGWKIIWTVFRLARER
jgi:glycosyltransferase involved in cell wall biosynthesis